MTRDEFLPIAKPSMGVDELAAMTEVVESGCLTTGPKVFEFERSLAEYLSEEARLSVTGLNSCTSGLFLSLKTLGIKEGDEVIVPTWTFAATPQVVEWIGAKPVLCDIEGNSLTIDVEKAEKLATNRTKAIIPVHIAGYPCDMEKVRNLADNCNLKVVEDAAHAIGTKFKGRKIGNFSDITCFSFYATKNLSMGEGGAAVSHDERLIDKIRRMAYFGINKEAFRRYEKTGTWAYDIEELGYKCNLDSIHAAIGLAQLKKLDSMNKRRRKIAQKYKAELDRRISFTRDSEDNYHTYHLFPILLPDGTDRDTFIYKLKENNVGTSVHFRPLHKHSHYKQLSSDRNFPIADQIYSKVVSIPMFPEMTDEDIAYVVYHINRLIRNS
jgi:dTDP-4-amino-4,6-dideoxygalactose transaminase